MNNSEIEYIDETFAQEESLKLYNALFLLNVKTYVDAVFQSREASKININSSFQAAVFARTHAVIMHQEAMKGWNEYDKTVDRFEINIAQVVSSSKKEDVSNKKYETIEEIKGPYDEFFSPSKFKVYR